MSISVVAYAALSVIKRIVLKVASEKFFEWVLFWAAKMLVDSTKTEKDNEWYDKIKETYYAKKEEPDG